MKRILVTGAGGFIGKEIIESLLKEDLYEIHATYHNLLPDFTDKIVWHRADLLNTNDVERVFSESAPIYLIQLAWCSEHGTYWKDPVNLHWLSANLVIAQQFVRHGGQRCLFAGTSAEYNWSGHLPLSEYTTLLTPNFLYGACKLASYWALVRFFEQEGISLVWARLFNPFGPNEDKRRLIPKTCQRLLNGDNICFDAGLSVRDFMYVKDVGAALLAALKSDVSGAINIAGGEPITIREVVSEIGRYYNCSDRITFAMPNAINNVSDNVVADVRLLREICHFRPKKTFITRLHEACDWWSDKN